MFAPMIHGWRLLLVLLACGAWSCAQDDGASVAERFALEGRVLDDDTGHPISGAKLTFISDTLDRTETRSDGDGHYEMAPKLRAGVLFGTLRVEHEGYVTSPAQTVYFDGTARAVDVRLRAARN
jgi:hypothetical protein